MFHFYPVVHGILCKQTLEVIGYPDQEPRSVAADLGLHCLSIAHKKTLGLLDGLKIVLITVKKYASNLKMPF